MALHIAAKVPRGDRGYFKEQLQPKVDGDQVRLVGEVKDEAKEKFSAPRRRCCFRSIDPATLVWRTRTR
jgi:hypothetical protein